MNYLGIDHGTKRVGLAIGSDTAGAAAPLSLLENMDDDALIEEIKAVVEAEHIGTIVLGLPIAQDGGSSAQADVVRAFGAKLEAALTIPVALQDERFSSREIEAHMEAMGGHKAWKAAGLDRDSAAAALFLQSYLDRMKAK